LIEQYFLFIYLKVKNWFSNQKIILLRNLNQAFVDTIRNTGRNNNDRLLIVTGANDDYIMTCKSDYKMPVDQSNKLAVSIHYFEPYKFVYNTYYEPYNSTDENSFVCTFGPELK